MDIAVDVSLVYELARVFGLVRMLQDLEKLP